ncbi:uncharacterized protein LOC135706954 [Ochlerotatus camptorhynchus]|uniref:uncharacterized protein LOC135706954 n=1 Tax=Ochlerotatus camptorhynchus TaxID=644619 RepID=UPI0031D28F84
MCLPSEQTKNLSVNMDAESSNNEEVTRLQQLLDESTQKLEEHRTDYEHNLKQYYSMKAQESMVELQFESWKQLYRKQEVQLADKYSQMRDAKLSIWRDREEFCDFSSHFAKHFSMDRCLIQLKRAANADDSPVAKSSKNLDIVYDPDEDLHSLKMAEIEEEIEKLKQKEVELNNAERELIPDEDTVRRLQETLNNSVSCLEDTGAEIRTFEGRDKDPVGIVRDSEVKSILKRPSFLTKEIERKKVRFE